MILGSYLLIGFLFSILNWKNLYLYSGLEMLKNGKIPTKSSLREAVILFIGIITIMWGFFILTTIIKLLLGAKNA